MTNADKIRAMSDEELAQFITRGLDFDCSDYCDDYKAGCAFSCHGNDSKIALKWLQSKLESE